MPRGSKTCPKCQTITGPRAWNCPKCGLGFILRGEKKPDLDVTANPPRSSGKLSEVKKRLWNLVEPYNGEDDRRSRKKYQMEGRTWQSKCGRYRIREQLTFMGVNMAEHYSKCVYLLKVGYGGWNIVRPKGRFKTPLAAIRRMVKDTNGQKAKATTKAEKLKVRVAQITNKESQYA